VNVSAHPAPTVQPPSDATPASGQRALGIGRQPDVSSARSADDVADVCILTSPNRQDVDRDSAVSGKALICNSLAFPYFNLSEPGRGFPLGIP
jgi:hypothetical protein